MEAQQISVKKRSLEGTSASRRMRCTGSLPGVIYGIDSNPMAVELETHAVEQLFHNHASETILVDINLEGEGAVSVLLKEVQHHPVSGELMHLDLQRVAANQTLQVEVSLELVGEPEGVKAGGLLDHVMHTILVECLPADLPETVNVDVSELEIGSALHVSDLKLGNKVAILSDADAVVAGVSAPKVEQEEDEDGDVAAEPEVITEKPSEE
ncbi:MAG: 50S ribosomal protein L25 [Pontiellaceae bacterium]|nr:50S ribosomal protein L25 [Kiritimatiellaceae bacterium]HBO87675.1 50S ribosomal protein L25 [Verrucomicrobiota bacterium]|tara:strand:+ start:169 stop:801 length:633 start_codon:yes stop_codon:yes gene_type:complete